MTVKSVLSATGKGLFATATAIHNSPLRTRMYEIDEEIAKLQEEKAQLEKQLIA